MQDNEHPFYPDRDPETGLEQDRRDFLENAVASLDLPSLFYGSLRHPGVFETVVGRPVESCRRERVLIDGFYPGVVDTGTGFPGIFRLVDSDHPPLECLLVHDLDRFEQAMVAWYEWDEYVLREVGLANGGSAQAFVPDLDAIQAEYGSCNIEPWSYESWRATHADAAIRNARVWMTQRPSDAALAAARCFPSGRKSSQRRAAG